MPKGKFQATDDFDLAGQHLVDWRYLSDIPAGGAAKSDVMTFDGSTWNPRALSTAGPDAPVLVFWDDIGGKPLVFPPDVHTHVIADLTDWPLVFPPEAHTHTLSEITDWPADHGDLTGLADPDHPLTALTQTGATTKDAVVWDGAKWDPAAVVNSAVAGTGIAVSGPTGDVTIDHAMIAGTSIDITGATISVKSVLTDQIKRFAAEIVVNGGGSAVTTGVKGYLEIPKNCTLVRVCSVNDVSGTVTWTIKKSSYAGFSGSLADITGGANFGVSSAQKNEDTTLTGWTTDINSGDILELAITGTPATTTVAMLSLTFEGDII